jgi:hypothetical protein
MDDTPANVDVLADILRDHYRTKVALDGERALPLRLIESFQNTAPRLLPAAIHLMSLRSTLRGYLRQSISGFASGSPR